MHPAVQKAIRILVSEGKTPTVATVKSKLTATVPMPVIIAALSAYKNAPDSIETEAPEQEQVEPEARSQLDRIEAKLDKLLAVLEERN
ncbi:hypothetical protein [Pseudoalteromonas luteoviolacea]|uniref:KfrA N-terminal DNA-binding domain-containing protein n=1 Tax=Pseudoalteromonas luteoviolacea NCIMB 1942 TaxID=1365253 RepID=A0A161Y4L2_9GAMM|nr:hypothetical protein [Pseudoalteromonas luteoviolacea]KZN50206.1 hypothetical protein N482_06455 [Pseudoalteromonas luteoviolacea NCIMB 1942]KZW99824.1 hypothetical protein JL49_15150 [Pseudoalteromonas luteoviolacea]